jgi:hypothetical protein
MEQSMHDIICQHMPSWRLCAHTLGQAHAAPNASPADAAAEGLNCTLHQNLRCHHLGKLMSAKGALLITSLAAQTTVAAWHVPKAGVAMIVVC